MNATDIITMKVVTVSPEISVRHAARIMSDRRVSGLPVLNDEHRLAGIVTEGGLLRRAELGVSQESRRDLPADQRARAYVKSHGWSVGDIMTKELVNDIRGHAYRQSCCSNGGARLQAPARNARWSAGWDCQPR